ncbi:IclR family transcriptional regulator [Henriciella aquimarina]|uniref:IclR family transcriptional regulator n=1 Tax=Henriciella aquimarina TaxID=545261 RepID=UPI0009FC12D6|nr:IclR family transcriptional regulator [Henriciella aquimarina]
MSQDRRTSLEKGLELLREILASRDNGRFKDVASRLNLPPSTAYRLVSQLADAGMVSRLGPNHYGPGLFASLLYCGYETRRLLVPLAKPHLLRLASYTGLTSHLGVLEEGMVTYDIRIPGRAPRAAGFTREGMQLEAYCSAVGKVLLAGLDDETLGQYLADGPFVALTPRTIIDPQELEAAILTVRQSGFAIDDREVTDDMTCIAVPVLGPRGKTIAAISVAVPTGGIRRNNPLNYYAPLRECAGQIESLACAEKLADRG